MCFFCKRQWSALDSTKSNCYQLLEGVQVVWLCMAHVWWPVNMYVCKYIVRWSCPFKKGHLRFIYTSMDWGPDKSGSQTW
jgi:hypothetical protein